jgi:DNA-directed RNA polymerase subunit RPC12/RpoP
MNHLKEHNSYDCSICDATFSHKNSLTMHIREVHEEKKVYKCHKCPSTFSYPKHLTKHFEESHTKMEEYILEVTEVQDEIIDMIDPNQIIENTNTTSSVNDTEENSDEKSNSNDTDIDILDEEEPANQSEQIIGI